MALTPKQIQESERATGWPFDGKRLEDDITLSDHEDERLEPFRAWMEGHDG